MYSKPEIRELSRAITAIQGDTDLSHKGLGNQIDGVSGYPDTQPFAAYQADE